MGPHARSLGRHAPGSTHRFSFRFAIAAGALLLAASPASAGPDWSREARLPPTGRANIYELPPGDLETSVRKGQLHSVWYPVEATAALVPERAVRNLIELPPSDPLRAIFLPLFRAMSPVRSIDDALEWLGLPHYPEPGEPAPYSAPYPPETRGARPEFRMGYTAIQRHGERGFTFGCVTCHSSELFGKRVLGLQNRFPRANEVFAIARPLVLAAPSHLFQLSAGASRGERLMWEDLQAALRQVDLRKPVALGLDTSLAQVALSLARRAPDEHASRSVYHQLFPRRDRLATEVADSKPAPWWNLKYKTRWLLDGSVVSGNPIFTNFIWNEIGRGTEVRAVEAWLDRNEATVRELTAAAFATEAPRFTDFFPAGSIPIERARRGEAIFNARCASCHGTYEKNWSLPGAGALPLAERLATREVRYHERTPVVDVGTDPMRRLGMSSLAAGLNGLAISRKHGIVIEPQPGYVPPPLVGVWARWPYFHNNSAPSLCAVLTPAARRPVQYHAGPAVDPRADFDAECNGYPVAPPAAWLTEERRFDTRRPGLSNAGHDEGILTRDGRELLTSEEKGDLIRFLQTL